MSLWVVLGQPVHTRPSRGSRSQLVSRTYLLLARGVSGLGCHTRIVEFTDVSPDTHIVPERLVFTVFTPWSLGTGDSTFHCYPLGCQFETRCGRVLKGHTVCGMAGQECGFAHVAGLVEWHHTCVRNYLRSFAGKHNYNYNYNYNYKLAPIRGARNGANLGSITLLRQ